MTALCGGGTSAAKPIAPAVAYLFGNALEGIVGEALALSESWASLLVFAAAQTFDLSTFCVTDPPALFWPTASDIQYITTHYWNIGAPEFQHLYSVIANGIWLKMCECTSAPAPTPPTVPSYPSTAPVINPGGFGSTPGATCWHAKDFLPVIPSGTTNPNLYPPQPGGLPNSQINTTMFAVSQIGVQALLDNTGATPSNGTLTIKWVNSTGTTLRTDTHALVHGTTTPILYYTPPTGWYAFVINVPDGAPTATNNLSAELWCWCGGATATTTAVECCPPDPTLTGLLNQILNLLQQVYVSIPTSLSSYASATVHSGLSGNGTITLTDAALAIKVDITTDPSNLGVDIGDPNYLFDRGFIVPIAVGGPIARLPRLVYNPQMYELPTLTEQIGYSLHPGVVISITELVRGP